MRPNNKDTVYDAITTATSDQAHLMNVVQFHQLLRERRSWLRSNEYDQRSSRHLATPLPWQQLNMRPISDGKPAAIMHVYKSVRRFVLRAAARLYRD